MDVERNKKWKAKSIIFLNINLKQNSLQAPSAHISLKVQHIINWKKEKNWSLSISPWSPSTRRSQPKRGIFGIESKISRSILMCADRGSLRCVKRGNLICWKGKFYLIFDGERVLGEEEDRFAFHFFLSLHPLWNPAGYSFFFSYIFFICSMSVGLLSRSQPAVSLELLIKLRRREYYSLFPKLKESFVLISSSLTENIIFYLICLQIWWVIQTRLPRL